MSDRKRVFKMDRDGALRFPAELREKLGWSEDTAFAVVFDGVQAVIVPVPKRESLAGSMRGANPEGYRDRDDRY